jgi:hypothetical protein
VFPVNDAATGAGILSNPTRDANHHSRTAVVMQSGEFHKGTLEIGSLQLTWLLR